ANQNVTKKSGFDRFVRLRFPTHSVEDWLQNRTRVLLKFLELWRSRQQAIDEIEVINGYINDGEFIAVRQLFEQVKIMCERLSICFYQRPGVAQQIDPVGFGKPR